MSSDEEQEISRRKKAEKQKKIEGDLKREAIQQRIKEEE